jgi:hypothetical protein
LNALEAAERRLETLGSAAKPSTTAFLTGVSGNDFNNPHRHWLQKVRCNLENECFARTVANGEQLDFSADAVGISAVRAISTELAKRKGCGAKWAAQKLALKTLWTVRSPHTSLSSVGVAGSRVTRVRHVRHRYR